MLFMVSIRAGTTSRLNFTSAESDVFGNVNLRLDASVSDGWLGNSTSLWRMTLLISDVSCMSGTSPSFASVTLMFGTLFPCTSSITVSSSTTTSSAGTLPESSGNVFPNKSLVPYWLIMYSALGASASRLWISDRFLKFLTFLFPFSPSLNWPSVYISTSLSPKLNLTTSPSSPAKDPSAFIFNSGNFSFKSAIFKDLAKSSSSAS